MLKEEFLAAGKAYEAVFWPATGVKERTINISVFSDLAFLYLQYLTTEMMTKYCITFAGTTKHCCRVNRVCP